MSTMIERVARAIMQARDGCRVTDWREAEWNPAVAQALSEARAAIAAMREPTEGMLAGTEAPGTWGVEPRFVVPVGYENGPIYREQCAEIYQAMIDAALQKKPEA